MNDGREWMGGLRDHIAERQLNKIAEARTQQHHMLVLAGAIAAFLMPVYMVSHSLLIQHSLLAGAIICFLVCILLGAPSISKALTREAELLDDMRVSLEKGDMEAYHRICNSMKTEESRKDHDFIGKTLRCLFSIGILLLIVCVVLRGYRP